MSPDFRAAAHTFQFNKCRLAIGLSPFPKRCTDPSGSLTVSVPCFKRSSSLSVARTADDALRGIANAEVVEDEELEVFIASQIFQVAEVSR